MFHDVRVSTIVEAVVAVLLLGCVPVVVKYISANAYTIGLFRLAVGAAGIFLWITILKKTVLRLSIRDLFSLMVIGLFFGLHWLTYFLSIKISSASVASIGLATYGVHLIFLSWIFQQNRLTLTDFTAVTIAIIGNLLIIPEYSLQNDITAGLLLGIVSGFLYAFLPILHQHNAHLPSSIRTLGQFSFALAFFAIFTPLTKWDMFAVDWFWLIFLAVVCTLVAHTLWVRVTTKLATTATSVIYYGYVPVAMGLSYFLLNEQLTLAMILGAMLIISGNILGLSSQWKRDAILAKTSG